jgi:hypothetical protein
LQRHATLFHYATLLISYYEESCIFLKTLFDKFDTCEVLSSRHLPPHLEYVIVSIMMVWRSLAAS